MWAGVEWVKGIICLFAAGEVITILATDILYLLVTSISSPS